MFLYDKTNILEGLGIFEVDFAHSREPATGIMGVINSNIGDPAVTTSQ